MKASHQELNQDGIKLYRKLIKEEFNEHRDELPGTPEDYKEVCDIMWVLIQYANQCGYDVNMGMNALVQEYTSKFFTKEGKYEPLFREDGKLLKNTGFEKADFSSLYYGHRN